MTRWLVAFLILIAACLAAIAFLSVRPAGAQSLCAPLPDLLRHLQLRFGEFVVMKGDAGPAGTVYVVRSDKGSWSVIFAHGEQGCLAAAGTASTFDVGT